MRNLLTKDESSANQLCHLGSLWNSQTFVSVTPKAHEFFYIKGCHTAAYRPKPSCLFLSIKIYGNTAMAFVYVSSLAAFAIQQQSEFIVTEPMWSAKPKVFTVSYFTLNFAIPVLHNGGRRCFLWVDWNTENNVKEFRYGKQINWSLNISSAHLSQF